MNICFVEWGYPSKNSGGGAGTYVQLTAKELIRRGHKVFVIAKYLIGEPEESIDDGVVVRRVRIKSYHYYSRKILVVGKLLAHFFGMVVTQITINREIARLHKKYKLDIVEFSETPNLFYMAGLKLPYAVQLHGSRFTFKKYCGEKITTEDKLQRKIEGLAIKRANLIMSPSNCLKGEIIREFGVSAARICVISYPADRFLLEIPIKPNRDEKIVFYAGRLERAKGVHVLKKAVLSVVKTYPDVKFLLFGSDCPGMTRGMLVDYFKKNGVAKKVEVCPFAPKEKLFEHLAEADICVVPSIWDNSPNVVYEAMVAGKAVVSTNVGGIPELVTDGSTAILVEPNDSILLSRAIIDLLENDTKRLEIGRRAREIAAKRFNIINITDERLKKYEEAISGY